MKKRGIIFDFDGTLVDSFSNRIQSHKKVAELITNFLKKRGVNANYHTMLEKVIKTEEEGEKRLIRSRDEWWKQIFEELNITNVPKDLIAELTNVYWEILKDTTTIYEGAPELLAELKQKGYKLGLLSDTDFAPGWKEKRFKDSGLAKFFDTYVVAGETNPEAKPSPQPFLEVIKRLNLKPEQVIHVGDNQETDIKGATAAAIDSLWIDWQGNPHGNRYGAIAVAKGFPELKATLYKVLEIKK
ncbi:MAG: HAD family hydrolase [Candidatus Jordarchaeum sp.]|uniref:HAD family hydrolase n=1 Tax=Candidatus Jordarchaeum sp. TaxID=2823881 RepID=UPI004048FD44